MIGIVRPEAWKFANPIFVWALGMGLYGLVSGFGFGGLLSLREGRKTILDLSLRRAAIWGVLGAAAVPCCSALWARSRLGRPLPMS